MGFEYIIINKQGFIFGGQEFVKNPEGYLYRSARDYSAGKGLLEILFIE